MAICSLTFLRLTLNISIEQIAKVVELKEEEVKDIIVTDLNSTDRTKEILNKLSTDYEYVKNTNWKECKEIIDNIDIADNSKKL